MLESTLHQAAGLLALSQQRSSKLFAMVSHGDERAELPLLWRLCWSLTDLGYAVTVLDATTTESNDNPGLAHFLQGSFPPYRDDQSAPTWTVVPAAQGIEFLCSTQKQAGDGLQRLGAALSKDGVVILYGKADSLVTLLGHSDAEPLLAVSPSKTSLMTSYLALKRLLIKGKLEPTIVDIAPTAANNSAKMEATVVSNLSECARNFLDYQVKTIPIAAFSDDEPPTQELQNLALRMLESATPLGTHWAAQRSISKSISAPSFAESH